MGTAFTPETLKFLRGLARHNDREWFEARRDVYVRSLKTPMLSLIEEINAAMVEFSPEHVRTPQKTMLRIYRDTRFSNDKRPYKKHVAAWFGRRTAVRTTGAGFYLHVSAAEVIIAGGVFVPLPEQLLAIRNYLAENHTTYSSLMKKATRVRKSSQPLQPEESKGLARMPKGFAADHPAGELLRAKRWGVHASWPAESALAPDFKECVVALFRSAAPVVNALDAAICAAPAAASLKRAHAMF